MSIRKRNLMVAFIPLVLTLAATARSVEPGCGCVSDGCACSPQVIIPKFDSQNQFTGCDGPLTWELLEWNSEKGINIVFLPDGFTSGIPMGGVQMGMMGFRNKVNEVMEIIESSPPFKRCGFNYYRGEVASAELGIDRGVHGDCRNTVFNTGYGDDCVSDIAEDNVDGRCVYTRTPGYVYAAGFCVTLDWDIIFVLVNDEYPGGCAQTYSDLHDRGIVYAAIGDPNFDELVLHELAHIVGPLYDEYEGKTGTYAGDYHLYYPNIGGAIDPFAVSKIKWHNLIDSDVSELQVQAASDQAKNLDGLSPVELAAMDAFGQLDAIRQFVGYFEGAAWFSQGAYRPQYECLMRDYGAGFCVVCTKTIAHQMVSHCPVWCFAPGLCISAGTLLESNQIPWYKAMHIGWVVNSCFLCPGFDGLQPIGLSIEAPDSSSAFIVDRNGAVVANLKSGSPLSGEFVPEAFEQYFLGLSVPAPPGAHGGRVDRSDRTLNVRARMWIGESEVELPR